METNANVFSNDDITVTYNPRCCANAELCARQLSDVFRSAVIPWINLDGAETDQVIQQVKKCPTGALQYYLNQKDVA